MSTLELFWRNSNGQFFKEDGGAAGDKEFADIKCV
jgi:hypothetical protein